MRPLSFTLNGKPTRLTVDETRPLLWVLRDDLGLTGTKFGCGEALCGSCTVVVDGEAVRSCTTAVGDVEGKKVLTIEGLATAKGLHPIQEAFVKHDAFQCGYCTPGMIMRAVDLVQKHDGDGPITEEEVRSGLEGNLCRCTGYQNIVKAVQQGAKAMT